MFDNGDNNERPVMDSEYILQQARKSFNEQAEQLQAQNTPTEEEQPQEPDNTIENEEEQEETIETTEKEEEEIPQEQPQEPEFETKRQREAFIRMRKEKEELQNQIKESQKYSKTIEALAKRSKMSVEEYIDALENNLLEEEAEQTNTPVDVLKRLKQLEDEREQMRAEKERIETEKKQYALVSRIAEFQKSMSLSDDEVKEFIQTAVDSNFDLENTTNLKVLYNGLFADRIIQKEADRLHQEKLARIKKGERAPKTSTGGATNVKTVSEVEKAMDKRVSELVRQRLGY